MIYDPNDEQDLLDILDGEVPCDNVLFLATTNYPEKLDKRVVSRPRRFDRLIKILQPDDDMRHQYLKYKLNIDESELHKWVKETQDLSYASLAEAVVSVKCFNHDFTETIERLREMEEGSASSEDYFKRKPGFGQ